MKKYFSIYAAAFLMLSGCTEDVVPNGGELTGKSNMITFSAQTVNIQDETRSTAAPEALPLTGDGVELWLMPSETPMVSDVTRGTQINSVEALNNFGVSAYRHGAIPTEKTLNEYLTDNNLKPDFFYNLEATKITDTQKFKLTKDFFWPTNDDVLSFFAYAPYGDENVELSAATADGPQSINFKVDTNVKKQVDLITAQASTTSHLNTSTTPSVALNFTHQLTGIRFVIGDQFLKGWIKSISLKGVYTQGTYTIGDGWTLDDTKKGNFTISYNLDKPVAGTPGEEVSASDEVFMMIPHTFAADDAATIEVVYNDKYTDYVVKCPLKGQTWKAGKTVTYAITSNKLTTLRIGQIQFATTPEGAPKRIWQAGDKIGMYVVDADGKKLKHKNVPVTYDGANWNIDHTTAEGTIYKLPGESFYFYYPYSNVSNGQPTGYPEQCPELKASAPVFFEGVINYFDYKKDQSTLANFLASDLQVARAEEDGHASMVKATMLRQVGLARMKFATSKTIPTTITRTNNGTASNSGTTTIYPSSNFSGNKPYLSGGVYYFFTKAGTPTTFNSVASDVNHWYSAHTFNLGAGEYTSDVEMNTQLVQDYRYQWQFVRSIYNYSYRGAGSTFTMPINGYCAIECWGAEGGSMNGWLGGKGAYTYGKVDVSSSAKLYVFVGAMGTSAMSQGIDKYCAGSFNGAGSSEYEYGRPGGGATDVRLQVVAENTTNWKDFNSLRSRIMVAAGGGGCVNRNVSASDQAAQRYGDGHGGYGGGLVGGDGTAERNAGGYGWTRGFGATQTSPGKSFAELASASSNYTYGDYALYFGAFGYTPTNCGQGTPPHRSEDAQGTGGGGYYGGGSSGHAGSGGGSSFISGHPGCRALDISNGRSTSQSNLVHKDASASDYNVHYSGYKFTNTSMIAGNAIQTKPGGTTETGHTGNGYCRITVTYE